MKLFIIEFMGTGGMIHYAYQLCTAFATCGADVTLVTTTNYELAHLPHQFNVCRLMRLWPMFDKRPRSTPSKRWQRWGYQLRWTLRRLWRGGRLIWAWVYLTHFLLKEQPDVVQFGKINFPFEVIFLRFLRWRGLRLTQICHEFELRERGEGWVASLNRWLNAGIFHNFTPIFQHGTYNRHRFLQLYPVSPDIVYSIEHGNENIFLTLAQPNLDLAPRYGLVPNQPTILFFGNLTPSKGIPDLIQAFQTVHQQYPEARLLIAGYPCKFIRLDKLYQQVAELSLTKAVIFDTRYIPFAEVGALMKLAQVVVYPYHNSTQSGALQVAYTFGRPVIATKTGTFPEVVEHGRSGFLVAPHHPPQLAQAMLAILSEPEQAEVMGAHAYHLSQTRFSWERVAKRILAVYDGEMAKTEEER